MSDFLPMAGASAVGSELFQTLGAIHASRANAHREKLENAISAGATTMEIDLVRSSSLGARAGEQDMLRVFTDTTIDLNRALEFGHAAAANGAPATSHGVLNNFGVGLKAFQAALGDRVQLFACTARRRGDGSYEMGIARFGSAIDAYFAAQQGSARLRIYRAGSRVKREPDGSLRIDARVPAGATTIAGRNPVDEPQAARTALLQAPSPWAGESGMLVPMTRLLARLEVAAAEGVSEPCGTLFIYHSDGSTPLPYQLRPEEGRRVHQEGGQTEAPGRLFVNDKDGRAKDLAHSLESAYLENESDALVQAWHKEGITSFQPPAMPSMLVQGSPLNFARHPWAVETERAPASPLIPVRVEGCAAPIAFMRCCFLSLSTEDGKKRKGKSTVKSDRRWLHGQKLDGAYLVMHGRKVINDSPHAMWDGTVFEEHTSTISTFYKATIAGGAFTPAQYANLTAYWAAGADLTSTPPELNFENYHKWSTRNKAQALWPRCGFGCLSLIHLSPSFFQLDASKTRVQRRECEATHNLSQRQLVQALRLSIAVWCCTNMPPELPREPSVRSRRGTNHSTAIVVVHESGAPSPGGWQGLDANSILERRVEVYWEDDRRFYQGRVVEYSEEPPPDSFEDGKLHRHVHLIAYDDGEDAWEPLLELRWHFLNEDGVRVDKDFRVLGGVGNRIVRSITLFSPPDFNNGGGKVKRKRPCRVKATLLSPAELAVNDVIKAAVTSASLQVKAAQQQNNRFEELECLRRFHTLIQKDVLPKL